MPKDGITDVFKTLRDGWEAKTAYHVEGERWLTITTSKGSRGVSTFASVARHQEDGTTTFVIYGDFSKRVIQSPERGTEKAIRAQHALVLEQRHALVAEARAFYAAKKPEAVAA